MKTHSCDCADSWLIIYLKISSLVMDVFPSEVYPSIDAIDHSPGKMKNLAWN